MHNCDATKDDVLVCPRAGCRDTVRNVRALRAHLAMHDIAQEVDGLYVLMSYLIAAILRAT